MQTVTTDRSEAPAAQLDIPGAISPSEAYERSLPEMLALAPESLASLNVDVPSAVQLGLVTASNVLPLRSALIAEVSSFRVSSLDNLAQYAGALFHAQTLYKQGNPQMDPLLARVARGMELRDLLTRDALAAAAHGLIEEKAIPALSGQPGYRNVAYDLGTLRTFFVAHWDAFASAPTWLTRAQLDEAERVAADILNMLAARAKLPVATAEQSQMRQRAFTLFVNAYEEVRDVVACLRRKEGDAALLVPSLYARRSRRSEDEVTDEGQNAPESTNATQGTNVTTNTNSSVDKDGPFTS